METKYCPGCDLTKPVAEFYPHRTPARLGQFSVLCRTCTCIRAKLVRAYKKRLKETGR